MSKSKKMTQCKSCGNEIAKSAKSCPHCGAKNKKPTFLIVAVIVLLIIILAASCGGGDEEAASPTNSSVETVQKAPEITYTEITVGELIDDLEANALNAADKHTDQYYAVTGKLSNIDSSGKYISISDPDELFSIVNVQCYIKTDEVKNIVKSLSTDSIITVKGQITDVGEVLGYSMNIDTIE